MSAQALVDLAVDLRAVGGIYGGNNRATEFLCLTLKLLQIQPEKEIILEFIKNEDHKYVACSARLHAWWASRRTCISTWNRC